MTKDLAKKYFVISIFLVIVSASLCVAAYYYVFYNNSKFPDLESQLLQEKADAESFRSAKNTISAIAEGKEKLSNLFLGQSISDKAEFISSIENTADSVPVELETTLGSQQVPKENRFQYFIVQGTVRGSFDAVYKFLLLLENYPKALDVTKVEIEKIPTDPKKGEMWRMSFVLRVIELK